MLISQSMNGNRLSDMQANVLKNKDRRIGVMNEVLNVSYVME